MLKDRSNETSDEHLDHRPQHSEDQKTSWGKKQVQMTYAYNLQNQDSDLVLEFSAMHEKDADHTVASWVKNSSDHNSEAIHEKLQAAMQGIPEHERTYAAEMTTEALMTPITDEMGSHSKSDHWDNKNRVREQLASGLENNDLDTFTEGIRGLNTLRYEMISDKLLKTLEHSQAQDIPEANNDHKGTALSSTSFTAGVEPLHQHLGHSNNQSLHGNQDGPQTSSYASVNHQNPQGADDLINYHDRRTAVMESYTQTPEDHNAAMTWARFMERPDDHDPALGEARKEKNGFLRAVKNLASFQSESDRQASRDAIKQSMQYQQQDASAKFINTLKSTAPDLVEYIATTNQTGFENPENRRQMLEAAKLTIDQMSESEGEVLRHMVTSIITRPPEQHQQQLNSKDGQSAVWTPHGYASAKDAELERLEQINLNIDQGGRFDNDGAPGFWEGHEELQKMIHLRIWSQKQDLEANNRYTTSRT